MQTIKKSKPWKEKGEGKKKTIEKPFHKLFIPFPAKQVEAEFLGELG